MYDELRKLAASYLANEAPGHTLDATALVHEAHLWLVADRGCERPEDVPSFANARHFFAAAAEAMRRILVDHARRKQALNRGGPHRAVQADLRACCTNEDRTLVLGVLSSFLQHALNSLPAPASDNDCWIDAAAAELAKLRIFGGLSVEEAAEALTLSRATAFRTWTYARVWFSAALTDKSGNP